MGTLYVLEQGATVHKRRERLVVRKERQVLTEISLVHLDQVVLFGGVHLTTPVADLLLDRDLPVAMCTRSGRLRGFLQPGYDRWVPTRRAQVRASDDPLQCVAVARACVEAKLRNQRTYLRRLASDGRADAGDAADALGAAIHEVASTVAIDRLRGLEGAAAARYFRPVLEALGELGPGVRRRAATSPGDALLNLVYGLLSVDVLRAVQLAGLDPFVGLYHRPSVGRANLVLDLMEEWRPVLGEPTAVACVNRSVLGPKDFVTGANGEVTLTNKAMRRVVAEYHRRSETVVTIDGASRPYREWVDRQAARLARSLSAGGAPYAGFVVP